MEKVLETLSSSNFWNKKYSELEPQFQKYEGKDILQGDIVKGDSGACAVFTE